MIDTAHVFFRVAAAGGLGALIGLERESRNQLAGMRTHALVAAGAAVFPLAGAYGFSDIHRGPNVDPMRVAAQIASGIGFIGAGAIIRDRGSVRGITTAAALWTSAAVRLAGGARPWWAGRRRSEGGRGGPCGGGPALGGGAGRRRGHPRRARSAAPGAHAPFDAHRFS